MFSKNRSNSISRSISSSNRRNSRSRSRRSSISSSNNSTSNSRCGSSKSRRTSRRWISSSMTKLNSYSATLPPLASFPVLARLHLHDAHTDSWPHKCSKAKYFLLIPHIILSKVIERPKFLSKFVTVQFPFELRHPKVSTSDCPCDIFAAAQWEADWTRELLGIGTTLKRG